MLLALAGFVITMIMIFGSVSDPFRSDATLGYVMPVFLSLALTIAAAIGMAISGKSE